MLCKGQLLEDFRWYEAPQVVLLNVPDNYKGLYLYRIINKNGKEGSGFEDALASILGKKHKGKLLEVTQYNMETSKDGVQVEQLSDTKLKVTFNQWGNWFWRNGIGAGSGYENDFYTVSFKGHWYEIELKKSLEKAVVIYQDGKEWKEFTLEDVE